MSRPNKRPQGPSIGTSYDRLCEVFNQHAASEKLRLVKLMVAEFAPFMELTPKNSRISAQTREVALASPQGSMPSGTATTSSKRAKKEKPLKPRGSGAGAGSNWNQTRPDIAALSREAVAKRRSILKKYKVKRISDLPQETRSGSEFLDLVQLQGRLGRLKSEFRTQQAQEGIKSLDISKQKRKSIKDSVDVEMEDETSGEGASKKKSPKNLKAWEEVAQWAHLNKEPLWCEILKSQVNRDMRRCGYDLRFVFSEKTGEIAARFSDAKGCGFVLGRLKPGEVKIISKESLSKFLNEETTIDTSFEQSVQKRIGQKFDCFDPFWELPAGYPKQA